MDKRLAWDAPAAIAPPAAPVRRPLAFLLHSLFGLKLSLFLGFVCLTGTVATVSHEIEWLLKPEVRASASATPAGWGRMWDAVRDAYPNARLQGIGPYDRSDAAYFAKTAHVTLASGQTAEVYVDPGTGAVTGEARGVTFHGFMRALHYYLLAPGEIPFYAVAALGPVLLLSLVTGLIAYKKFWRGFLRTPRWGRDARTVWGDVHRLVGLWSVPFAAIISLTTIWYIVERAGVDFNTPEPAGSVAAAPPTGAEIDRWVAAARERMPGLSITGVTLPYEPGGVAVVQGQRRAWLVRERTNAVYIDPATGRVAGVRDAGAIGAGERWVHTADPLHFGNFAGLATKLLWVVFGLALTLMAWSGAAIFTKRTAKAARQLRLRP